MQHHKIFRLNATLIIFRVALSFTFHTRMLFSKKNNNFIDIYIIKCYS